MKKIIIAGLAALLAFAPALAQERGRGFGGFGRGGFERGGGRFGGGMGFGGAQRGPGGFGGFAARRPGPGAGPGPGGFERGPYGGAPMGPPAGFAPRARFPAPRAAPFPGPGGGGGFRRGQFLPQGYWGGAVADPRQYHLRRPPNGYGWVTVGPNAYLMQQSTGLILDTAPLY